MSSWWLNDLPAVPPRPPLGTDLDVDVAIVGAGCTGLWTAYALAGLDPTLRIAVLERDVAGAGASGRNGGWCAAGFAASWATVAAGSSPAAALALHHALADTVDEVGRVAAAEGIDARFAKGGTLTLARSAAQLTRLHDQLRAARSAGLGPQDLVELTGLEARERVAATGVVGGLFTPHCAVLDPARLVRGLAAAVERRGVAVYERTPVTRVDGRQLTAGGHRVRADVVVTATEGYGQSGRRLLPISSLMVVTEPQPPAVWDAIGWHSREAVKDARHLIIYAQRTADGRIALGGRGAPYRYGSRVPAGYRPAAFTKLWETLVEMFPQVSGGPADTWGGVLGAPRDWYPSVGLDRATGQAWAGGYVGQGVAAANLAGRTLADLILERDTDLVTLPWVGHRSPRWEPEPLRWLGATAMTWAMGRADRSEARTGRPSSVAARAGRLVGQ